MILKLWIFISLLGFSFLSWSETDWLTCHERHGWANGECVEINRSRVFVVVYEKGLVKFYFSSWSGFPNVDCEREKLEEGRKCE